MELKLSQKTFLELKNIPPREADVVLIPFGLEKTIEYGTKGTKKGPQRIIEISPNLEFFDEDQEREIDKEVKISTLQEPKIVKSHEDAIKHLEEIVGEVYGMDKFPFALGGEHSLTLGPVRAALKKYKNISILQFDAHADLRDEYEGSIYNHASVMRQCLKLGGTKLTQIGIRNISTDTNEFVFWKENQSRIKTFWAKDMAKWKTSEIVKSLDENVYLTFDVDAFDCSLMPSVGTPEPGGLQWFQAMDILKAVAAKRKIIGADVVELSPIKGLYAPDFVAAKLVYKIIGLFCSK
ncbi:MAG: agmatinase [Candidatus Portnoybacteria bacterium]|nr:agmatinase [Candidatus Portnoybacteria bacterium]